MGKIYIKKQKCLRNHLEIFQTALPVKTLNLF